MAGRTSVRRPGQIQERALGPRRPDGRALTRSYVASGYFLDAEEVRGDLPFPSRRRQESVNRLNR